MADVVMVPLVSTNVAAAGYDDDARELYIEFTSGGTYIYEGVSRGVYDGLIESPSPGSYVHRNVRDQYRFRQE